MVSNFHYNTAKAGIMKRDKNDRGKNSRSEQYRRNRYFNEDAHDNDIYENEFGNEDEHFEDEYFEHGEYHHESASDIMDDADGEEYEHQRFRGFESTNPNRKRKPSRRRQPSYMEQRRRRLQHYIMESLRVSAER